MEPNDVLGLTLDAATKKLNKLDSQLKIIETESLRVQDTQEGTFRVIKQISEGDNQTLILCRIPDFKGVLCHKKE